MNRLLVHSPEGCSERGRLSVWTILHCFTRQVRRKLDQKQSRRDSLVLLRGCPCRIMTPCTASQRQPQFGETSCHHCCNIKETLQSCSWSPGSDYGHYRTYCRQKSLSRRLACTSIILRLIGLRERPSIEKRRYRSVQSNQRAFIIQICYDKEQSDLYYR